MLRENIMKVYKAGSQEEITETQELLVALQKEVTKAKVIKEQGLAALTLGSFIREVNRSLKTLLMKVIATVRQLVQQADNTQVWASTGKQKLERGAQIITSKTNRHRANETNVLNMLQG